MDDITFHTGTARLDALAELGASQIVEPRIEDRAHETIAELVTDPTQAHIEEPAERFADGPTEESAEQLTTSATEDITDESTDQPLHPKTSERKYWREPFTKVQREIWRPGDGDGVLEDDYFDRPPPLAPIEKRWRLYQLSTGPIRARLNEPPKNVVLDDLACHAVLQSNIPKVQLAKHWSHDFNGPGKLRHQRTHCGRAAVINPTASDPNSKFGTYRHPAAKAGEVYVFTGERNYEPVTYRELSPSPEPEPAPRSGKKKQHNQYTPLDELVRNGAPSESMTKGKYLERLNTYLKKAPEPAWTLDAARMYGGKGLVRHAGFAANRFHETRPTVGRPCEPEDLWVSQPDYDTAGEAAALFDGEKSRIVSDEWDDEPGAVSIFDHRKGNNENEEGSGNLDNKRKRIASSPLQMARAAKAPREEEMGHLERLAAGLPPIRFQVVEDDGAAFASDGEVATAFANRISTAGVSEAAVDALDSGDRLEPASADEMAAAGNADGMDYETRIRDLESQVHFLREKLRERDAEVAELKQLVTGDVD